MPRITAEDLLERAVPDLKEKESEKKKELNEIQKELEKNQKFLDLWKDADPDFL